VDRFWLVRSLTELGRLDEAAREQTGALRVAESTGQLYPVAQALQGAVLLHLLRGDGEEARRLSEQFLSVARTGNMALFLGYALVTSAQTLAPMGHVAEAAKRVSEGERLLEDLIVRGAVQPLRLSYHLLGRSCFLLDRLDEARSFADRALALAPFNAFLPYALHLLGELASHPQQWDPDRGIGRYEEALGIAAARSMRPLVVHCHLGLGKLYRRTGKRQQAQEHLTIATTMYREMDMRFWLEQAQAKPDGEA
jgi:tetratricopeptide (TPR) repeat protein